MLSTLVLVAATLASQNDAPARSVDAVNSVAGEPSAEALRDEVRRLVRQLDDPSQAQRDAAEKELSAQGPEVLPLLPPITPRTPAETKERLGRVRKALEIQLSESSSRPTKVSLQGEMEAPEAFAAVEKQTGNKFAGHERRTGAVQVDFSKTLFWEALDELLDQSGLDINAYGGQLNTLVLTARPEGAAQRSGAATYSGIFRFEPLRIEARRDLRNPSVNGMRLTLEIAWEPRVTLISLRQPINQISAVDELGNMLSIRGDETPQVLSATAETGMSAVELGIPLELPSRDAKKIAALKASLTALVPGRLESFEFADIEALRDTEQQRAGVTVTFERIRRNGDLFEVRLRVRYDEAGNALESHRGWIYSNPAYIVNAKGERVESLGANEGSRDVNEIGIVMLFDLPDGPQGCKFIYQTPASMLQLPVEYTLQDIQLP